MKSLLLATTFLLVAQSYLAPSMMMIQALKFAVKPSILGGGGGGGIFRSCRSNNIAWKTRTRTRRAEVSTMSTTEGETLEWPVEKVRNRFVEYFVSKHNHVNFKSSPVVPVNDPTLLFANSGMNQFKPIFQGTVDPNSPLKELSRAVNTQKCIRAGGKHNDLDDVGKDTYHHTFFEMLGTWSFGNYFKKEAIDWAWDILVNEYKLPSERLYASYFGGDAAMGLPCDDEARELWLQYLPPERVLPFDKKANFWEMGETGPCGPCSEIHFDRIGGRDASKLVNADDPDVIEIWNLVFMQFNREPNGELRSLPNKHIDTGMGLERLTSVLQAKRSNYDTDVFMPFFQAIQKVVGCPPYTGLLGEEDAKQNFKDTAYRVVADHVRTLTFAITDGAVPSNEGRGYVLRRILRRAVRYGMQTLGAKPGFFAQLVPVVAQELGGAFPELFAKNAAVMAVVAEEEKAFSSLLERGVKYFSEMVLELKGQGVMVVPGDRAFYLYDTLGFPVDLTQIMASETGMTVDLVGFQNAMTEQKQRSRVATRAKRLMGRTALALGAEQTAYLARDAHVVPTDDLAKYTWDQPLDVTVKAIFTEKGFVQSVSDEAITTVGVVLDASPFYAEAGGQVPDGGEIRVTLADGSTLELDVLDVQSYGGYLLHTCVSLDEDNGKLQGLTVGSPAVATVDYVRRRKVAPNHTMTHVLNFALREVLGDDVDQKGSLVSDEKFRFDFSFGRAVTSEELSRVEKIVNEVIHAELDVNNEVVPLKDALAIQGLRAVFGETYPDPVRVVSVGPKVQDLLADPKKSAWMGHSIEFCGGTHLSNTREAEAFVVTEETAVAKGIRRVSGVTGRDALAAQELAGMLKLDVKAVCEEVTRLSTGKTQGDASLLEAQVVALRARVDESVVSQAVKSDLRGLLEAAGKDLAGAKNKQMMAQVDVGIQKAKAEAALLSQQGVTAAVLVADIGSDAKAIKRAIDEIRKVAENMSFLCVSTDAEKITVFAYATDEAVAKAEGGIKANDWVSRTLQAVGGRGGGKPGMAQGSVGAPDAEKVAAALNEAKNYLTTAMVA